MSVELDAAAITPDKPVTPVAAHHAVQRLGGYRARFDRGRPWVVELVWTMVSGMLVETFLPGSAWRRALLRAFGARIGRGVVLKPGVKIKFPWRLTIGDDSWIGERVWIDNLASVEIGSDVCISQGAYLCTGSHDRGTPTFDLITRPIHVGDSAWVTAFCVVAPGARIRAGDMFPMGSRISGNPARARSPAHESDRPLQECNAS